MTKISELGVDLTEEQSAQLQAVFHDGTLHPFAGLKTEYLQEKLIRENFDYVVSSFTCINSSGNTALHYVKPRFINPIVDILENSVPLLYFYSCYCHNRFQLKESLDGVG